MGRPYEIDSMDVETVSDADAEQLTKPRRKFGMVEPVV